MVRRLRVECAGCSRLVEWRDPVPAVAAAPASTVAESHQFASPERSPVHPPNVSPDPDRSSHAKSDALPAPATVSLPKAPEEWLYISRRLELVYLPNAPLWSAPVIILAPQSSLPQAGPPQASVPQVYFRLTPSVYVWFVRASAVLEQSIAQGRASPADAEEYVRVMREVDSFAARHLSREWVEAAMLTPGSLPPVDRVAMAADW